MAPTPPPPSAGPPIICRIAALPGGTPPHRIALLHEDRLILADVAPEACAGLHEGDLVTVTLVGERIATLERLGGPGPGGLPADGDAWRWRRPGAETGRMARLRLRHRALQAVRAWFAERDFLELDTPALVPAPSPEPQFAPFPVGNDFLITSPEFQLKRLLVGGFERIYRLGPVFRGGERGARHNPEFTLLEWYRVGAGLDELAADLESLLAALLPLAESLDDAGRLRVPPDPFHPSGAQAALVDPAPPFPRATVAELLRERLGVAAEGITEAPALRQAALRAGVPGAEALPDDFERAFFALWGQIEPDLGRERPLLVVDWPAPLASLARLKPGDHAVADRMEWFLGGIELANGFAELTDAAEQRRRFEAQQTERRAQGLPDVPLDARFLAALEEGMPPAAGMALGFDRLVMLLAGTAEIRDVLPFAWDER